MTLEHALQADSYGATALHVAVRKGISLWLDNGHSFDSRD